MPNINITIVDGQAYVSESLFHQLLSKMADMIATRRILEETSQYDMPDRDEKIQAIQAREDALLDYCNAYTNDREYIKVWKSNVSIGAEKETVTRTF